MQWRAQVTHEIHTMEFEFKQPLLTLKPVAGHFDSLEWRDGTLRGHGWLFALGKRPESATLFVNGQAVGVVRPESRPDVEEACRWANDSQPLGFRFELSNAALAPKRVDVVAISNKRPIGRLSSYVLQPQDRELPLPPSALAERVSGVSGEHFLVQGLKMFTDLTDVFLRYGIPTTGQLLDWGCGCGRVARYFLSRLPAFRLTGCDIDPEAIEWCGENLPGGVFLKVKLSPPTPFEDNTFQVILACSVLTHLDREAQAAWLAEIQRLLAPGGYFLASTNAEFAYRLKHPDVRPTGWRRWLERVVGTSRAPGLLRDIDDSMPDPNMRWFVPETVYRMVFQPKRYTVQLCSRYLRVVAYLPCGLDGFQDLIVCQKPKTGV